MRVLAPSARRFGRLIAASLLLGTAGSVSAHDIGLDVSGLPERVRAIEDALGTYARRSPLPEPPSTPAEQRRALGEAEVEHALGHEARALGILLARLDDPEFRSLPEHADALILTSLVLERMDELEGSLAYARAAIDAARKPRQLTEAVGRWFRLARATGRMEGRLEVFAKWRAKGGTLGDGELGARVAYEVGFALRAMGRRDEARSLLARVPSSSRFGSRAAYLTATLFVEQGDLGNAERWFAAIMDWPLPDFVDDAAQLDVERELRALAALSAARLRFDRGALVEARAAYLRVPADSRHRREACWELAYLDAERGLRRAAVKHLECVEALGAPAGLRMDMRLFRSSLLAHLDRYAASLDAYQATFDDVRARRDLVAAAFERIEAPASFLFEGMERSAVEHGRDATPGPATWLAGAWTDEVDRAYRVDRGAARVVREADALVAEVEAIDRILRAEDGFEPLELRLQSLKRLLREIDHLSGHAGELFQVSQASLGASGRHRHPELEEARRALERLPRLRRQAEAQLAALAEEARRRTAAATAALLELRQELEAIRTLALELRSRTEGPADAAAREALDGVLGRLDDAAMRAESGVLDTYWIRKQRRTRAVERLIDEQKQSEAQMDAAVADFE